jgi:hypothetical protein
MDLVGIPIRLIGHGRAAIGAETALDTGRGCMELPLAAGIGELLLFETHECRHSRSGVAAAALTVTVCDPQGLSLKFELEVSTKTPAFCPIGHETLPGTTRINTSPSR